MDYLSFIWLCIKLEINDNANSELKHVDKEIDINIGSFMRDFVFGDQNNKHEVRQTAREIIIAYQKRVKMKFYCAPLIILLICYLLTFLVNVIVDYVLTLGRVIIKKKKENIKQSIFKLLPRKKLHVFPLIQNMDNFYKKCFSYFIILYLTVYSYICACYDDRCGINDTIMGHFNLLKNFLILATGKKDIKETKDIDKITQYFKSERFKEVLNKNKEYFDNNNEVEKDYLLRIEDYMSINHINNQYKKNYFIDCFLIKISNKY